MGNQLFHHCFFRLAQGGMVDVREWGAVMFVARAKKAEIFAGFPYGAVVGAIPVPTC